MRDGKERSVMGKMFLMLSSSFPKSLNERKEKKSVWEDSSGGIVLVTNVVVVVVVIQICIHRGNFKKPWIFFEFLMTEKKVLFRKNWLHKRWLRCYCRCCSLRPVYTSAILPKNLALAILIYEIESLVLLDILHFRDLEKVAKGNPGKSGLKVRPSYALYSFGPTHSGSACHGLKLLLKSPQWRVAQGTMIKWNQKSSKHLIQRNIELETSWAIQTNDLCFRTEFSLYVIGFFCSA